MKNLPQRERQKRRAQSGYSLKGKVPYQYSAELRGWREAARKNDARAMAEQDAAWCRKFGPRSWDAEARRVREAAE